ncbi:putative small secreted protein [Salipiger aestuarii]|uniref:Putative small secreted protein n=1 Tax=Salipiger aestuarii TaxID=568098 RepID=A0A327XMX4_9RHOB|nr:putative small secreted protein [Salipiger aestuarii]
MPGGGKKTEQRVFGRNNSKDKTVLRQAIIVTALAALVAGCGTVDGVGQDISSASRTVQSWF